MQDDLIVNVSGRLNGYLPASSSPSVVVRVFLPPFDEWEQRTGNSFGLRMSIDGYKPSEGKRRHVLAGHLPAPELQARLARKGKLCPDPDAGRSARS